MKKGLTTFLAVLLLMSTLCGCQSQQTSSAPELLEPAGVKMDTATVTRGDIFDVALVEGSVVPYVEEVQFTIDGKLGALYVQVGDTVKEGQLLATLDTESTNKQIETLQNEIKDTQTLARYTDRQAEIDIEIAQAQLAIQKESGVSAEACKAQEIKIEQMKTDLAQTKELRKMELDRKKASLAKLQENLPNMEMRAPFSGQVVYVRNIKEGNNLSAYTTLICIADETKLSISTEYISERSIKNAEKIYAKIDGTDYDVTYVPYDLDEYISAVLAGKEMYTEFSINEPSTLLQSGQYVALMMVTKSKEKVLTLPINALYKDNNGYYVYKIVDGNRSRCPIGVGVISTTEAEITEGLQEGDVVYVQE